MALLHRKPAPLAPDEKIFRDDRLIVVVADDTFAPDQYFKLVKARRVHVRVACAHDGHSSPQAALQSARALRNDRDFKNFDEFWLLLDTDHWNQPGHVGGFMETIRDAREEGFRVAISNPCFDLWLSLHHVDLTVEQTPFKDCDEVAKRFRAVKGEFNKTRLNPAHYNAKLALEAIARGQKLTPNLELRQLENPGTQVWGLVEKALKDLLNKVG